MERECGAEAVFPFPPSAFGNCVFFQAGARARGGRTGDVCLLEVEDGKRMRGWV